MLSSDLSIFIAEVFKFLIRTEAFKWRMPWRWSSWSHTYKTTINQQTHSGPIPVPHSFLLYSDNQSPIKLGDDAGYKKKMKKLKKRLELVENLELQRILNANNLTTSKQAQKPVPKQQKQK